MRTLLLFLLTCLFSTGFAQTAPPVIENFDSATFPPEGWTQQQFEGTQKWVKCSNPAMYRGSGSAYAMISQVSTTALISPAIAIPETGDFKLTFWTKFMFLDLSANYEVWISKSGNDTADSFKVLKTLEGDDEISESEWKEISVNIPGEYNGETVYVAFVTSTAKAGFYAWAVDDFELAEIIREPVFSGSESVDMGVVYNNLPFPAIREYAVTNKGGSPLTISSLVSATSGIGIRNLPLTVEPGATGNLVIELDATTAALPPGQYVGSFTIASNDYRGSDISIAMSATVEERVVSDYVDEGFDSSISVPAEWSVEPATGLYAFAVKSGRGIDNSNCLNVELFNSSKTAIMRTGCVAMGQSPRLGFWYKLTDWSSSAATSSENAGMTVRVSDDGAYSWNTVYTMLPGEHVESSYFALVDIDLGAYAGKTCQVEITFTQEANGADFYVDIDNVTIGTPPANDLSALSISGSAIPQVNTPAAYLVVVSNNGQNTQNSSTYSVCLMKDNGIEVATLSGVEIKQGEKKTFEFTYTPETTEPVSLYGKVELTGDEASLNDETARLKLNVRDAGITLLPIGDGETTANCPVNFSQPTSVSQSLYLPNEIGSNGGIIKGLVYKSRLTASYSDEPIKVWVGETDKLDYSDYKRIDPNELTLVFDGTVDFSGTDGAEVVIPFDTPYEYHGKTFVTYVYRQVSEAHADQDLFYCFNPGISRTLVSGSIFGELDPMNQYTVMIQSNAIPVVTLLADLSDTGSLSGVVSDANGPVAEADVKLADSNLSTTTDDSGRYSFPHLTSGTHTIEVSKFGYLTTTKEFGITAGEITAGDISLPLIVGFPVSGKVTDANTGEAIEGVTVVLKGYENYRTVSDAAGDYLFPDVYAAGYEIVATSSGYKYFSSEVEVSETTVKDIALTATPYPVADVNVEIGNGSATISWEKPEAVDVYRYDSGVPGSQTGFISGTAYGVFGAAHRESATLTEMSWYLTSFGGLQENVNLFVFALDDNGLPTPQILYSAMDVPTVIGGWSSYTFPEPVEAPDGFYIALGRNSGFLSLGVTQPSEKYPLVSQTQFYTGDYRTGVFVAVENPGIDGSQGEMVNYMIRAKGTSHGKVIYYSPLGNLAALEPAPERYIVYRLEDGASEDSWSEIGDVTELSYSDNWDSLEDGKVYRYAVVAEYAGGNRSEATLSSALPKGMEVEYVVNLATNCGDSPEGAVLTLENNDNDPAHAYVVTAGGEQVTFPAVWRGTYSLTIAKAGFNTISIEDVVIDHQGLSRSETLTETIEEPFGLEIEVEDGNATLTWNNAPTSFFDDMENHDDFIIDNIGEYTLYDGDGQPSYWFNDIYYDNKGYVGSYIVMNPSQTIPQSNARSFMPYSGDKYLACFATRSQEQNNDWLILPKLRVTDGSVFRFMAQNFTVGYDVARFKVGVSVSGTAPEDFEIISDGEYVEAPYAGKGISASWQEIAYDLSDYAGSEVYIAIACVSNDLTSALMIDDIELVAGNDTPLTNRVAASLENVSYTVYLDGEEAASAVGERQYRFSGLGTGSHTAGVQSVYRSGVSSVVTIDFEVTASGEIEITAKNHMDIYLDPVTDVLYVSTESELTEIAVYDINGRIVARQQGNRKEMALGMLPSGCYVARIATANGTFTAKLLKH